MSAGWVEDHAADELSPIEMMEPQVRDGLEGGLAIALRNSDASVEMQLPEVFEGYAFVVSAVEHDIKSWLIDEDFTGFGNDHVSGVHLCYGGATMGSLSSLLRATSPSSKQNFRKAQTCTGINASALLGAFPSEGEELTKG